MDAKQRKDIRRKIAETLAADRVIVHRDDAIECRWSYFYRFGGTVEKFQARVEGVFPGVRFLPSDCYDNWQPWPKDSYFKVTFLLPVDPAIAGAC